MVADNNCKIYCCACDESIGAKRIDEHKSRATHQQNSMRRKELAFNSKRNPRVSVERLPPFVTGPSSVETQIQCFINELSYDRQECHEIKQEILDDLKGILSKTFGRCSAQFFGSMTTGLALVGSDVDIYVDIYDFKYDASRLNRDHIERSKVFRVSEALFKDRNFSEIVPIFGAAVPIVKMVHVPTSISCDISFMPMGVESSRLIQFYLRHHARISECMLILKYWAKKQGICSGQSCISSYSWALLFVSYLQSLKLSSGKPVLPPFVEATKAYPRVLDEARTVPTPIELPAHLTHLRLLKGFFQHYASFPFGKQVVSPLLGEPVDAGRTLPSQGGKLHIWQLCLDAVADNETTKTAIIQDPLVPGSVIWCTESALRKVQACLAQGANILKDFELSSPVTSTILSDLFRGTSPETHTKKLPAHFAGALQHAVILSPSESAAEACGFVIHVRQPRAEPVIISAIKDVLSKVLLFELYQTDNRSLGCTKLTCVRLSPCVGLTIGKEVLNEYVHVISTKSVAELKDNFSEELIKRGWSFKRYTRKLSRPFTCTMTTMGPGPSAVAIRFEPLTESCVGFTKHLCSFLSTSFENWVNEVLSYR